MNRTEFRNERGDIGRAEWGAGPWQDEPDKVTWVDDPTSLDCLILRNYYGSLCGYVGVPVGHVAYGKDYEDNVVEHIRVHWGLNFAGPCDENEDPADGICHVPAPGRSDDVWWFGFDCSHAWDLSPGLEAVLAHVVYRQEFDEVMRPTYKTVEYVTLEVTSLAVQLFRGLPVLEMKRFQSLEVPDGGS